MCCGECLRSIVEFILYMALRIFFREVQGLHTQNIPETGPVLFVCAPHANQFVDPLIVSKHAGRKMGFLSAAKSMRRKFVGRLIKIMGSIPVERPQDLAKTGTGTITIAGTSVLGNNTAFTKEFTEGTSIFFPKEDKTLEVGKVVDDTHLELSKAGGDVEKPVSFKIVPKVDQSSVYEAVWQAFLDGECVGVFPEGGSHDRPELLPLKAGATVMVLGALAKYPDLNVRIVPAGLNYYHADRFRSQAFVDYGTPITIPKELVDMYKEGGPKKREACGQLLKMIHRGLLSVTVGAPDYETLQLVNTTRRLYHPPDGPLETNPEKRLRLNRALLVGYRKFKDNPELKSLFLEVKAYQDSLDHWGLTDRQVAKRLGGGSCRALCLLISRIVYIAVTIPMIIPGLFLLVPTGLIANKMSRKKAIEAKAASNVKLEGRDVLATWKLLIGAVIAPLFVLFYAAAVAIVLNVPTPFRAQLPLWVRAAAPPAVLVVLPLFAYLTIRFGERGVVMFRSLRVLLWASVPCVGSTRRAQLLAERERLQKRVVEAVAVFGKAMKADEFMRGSMFVSPSKAGINPEQLAASPFQNFAKLMEPKENGDGKHEEEELDPLEEEDKEEQEKEEVKEKQDDGGAGASSAGSHGGHGSGGGSGGEGDSASAGLGLNLNVSVKIDATASSEPGVELAVAVNQ